MSLFILKNSWLLSLSGVRVDRILVQILFISENALSTEAVDVAIVFFMATTFLRFSVPFLLKGTRKSKSSCALSTSMRKIVWFIGMHGNALASSFIEFTFKYFSEPGSRESMFYRISMF